MNASNINNEARQQCAKTTPKTATSNDGKETTGSESWSVCDTWSIFWWVWCVREVKILPVYDINVTLSATFLWFFGACKFYIYILFYDLWSILWDVMILFMWHIPFPQGLRGSPKQPTSFCDPGAWAHHCHSFLYIFILVVLSLNLWICV